MCTQTACNDACLVFYLLVLRKLFSQAERKTDGVLAAAKIIDVKDESELDDFMVEIDILSECKHSHVVGMYEAYYHENKLWVSTEVKANNIDKVD